VGILGGYTTFSSYSYETLQLVNGGDVVPVLFNTLGQLLTGLLAVYPYAFPSVLLKDPEEGKLGKEGFAAHVKERLVAVGIPMSRLKSSSPSSSGSCSGGSRCASSSGSGLSGKAGKRPRSRRRWRRFGNSRRPASTNKSKVRTVSPPGHFLRTLGGPCKLGQQ
jgi:hypothetical protein